MREVRPFRRICPSGEIFLSILGAVVHPYDWLYPASCLMDNHCAFMIEETQANPETGLRQLCRIYTQKYGRGHHETGHIFSRGYTFKEIADYPGIHYTNVSKVIVEATESRKQTFKP